MRTKANTQTLAELLDSDRDIFESDFKDALTKNADKYANLPDKKIPSREKLLELKNIYPLNSVSECVVGPDLLQFAQFFGDKTTVGKKKVMTDSGRNKTAIYMANVGATLHSMIRTMTYRRMLFAVGQDLPRPEVRRTIPGHLWGEPDPEKFGPRAAKVMVVGKFPGKEEMTVGRNFYGASNKLFKRLLEKHEFSSRPHDGSKWKVWHYDRWYVTNLLKLPHPDPKGNLKKVWIDSFLPILMQEILLVRPKYILCLGPEAAKAIIGKWANVAKMQGRVEVVNFPYIEKGERKSFSSKVMVSPHPAAIFANAAEEYRLDSSIKQFKGLIDGSAHLSVGGEVISLADDRNYQVIDNAQALKDWMTSRDNEGAKIFSVDAEWHGRHPESRNSYLRTIQIAWKPKHAICVRLTLPGGKPGFLGGDPIDLLRQFLCRKGNRIGGHFLMADICQLTKRGLDLLPYFKVPLKAKNGKKAYLRTKNEGGFDSGIAGHAVHETGELGLEEMGTRYLGTPRYQAALEQWKADNPGAWKDGYGWVPPEILELYGMHDADVPLRLMIEKLDKLLDEKTDEKMANTPRLPYWLSMRALPSIIEMTRNGLVLNRDNLDGFYDQFSQAHGVLLDELRQDIQWPEFNLSSVIHVRELLFGHKLNGAEPDENGRVRKRPKGARCLKLDPVLTSGKKPKPWERVVEQGKEDEYKPGTGKSVLNILYYDTLKQHPEKAKTIERVRDLRYIYKVLTSTLRPPKPKSKKIRTERDKPNGKVKVSDLLICEPTRYTKGKKKGRYVFDEGLGYMIDVDGRIRSMIMPTTDTARWRSFSPNLQNLSNVREKDYRRIIEAVFGVGTYPSGLRSMFEAAPGYRLVTTDYGGAELFAEAVMSGDETMLDHVQRSIIYDEDDERYHDIHSTIAVIAFNLKCPPTKAGLKSIDKEYLRNIAKTVVFGALYGRQAAAVSRTAREEGVDVSVEDADRVLAALFELYPDMQRFLIKCDMRVMDPGWICGAFGRFRHFAKPHTEDDLLDLQRKARNFIPQNFVADALNISVYNLAKYRQNLDDPDAYRLVLAVHDEVILEVKEEWVRTVVTEVMPSCMSAGVAVRRRDLDGNVIGDKVYHMGIDTNVYSRWKVKLPAAERHGFGLKLSTEEKLSLGLAT